MGLHVKYTSFQSAIVKDLESSRKRNLRKAALIGTRAIKKKARQNFKKHSGNLIKGITWKEVGPDSVIVGPASPAQHAHLLELGTKDRKHKKKTGKFRVSSNIKTKKGKYAQPKGGNVGKITPKPFIVPALLEVSGEVTKQLQERWLD